MFVKIKHRNRSDRTANQFYAGKPGSFNAIGGSGDTKLEW